MMKIDKLMFTDNSHISWMVSAYGVDLLLDTRLKFTGSPSLKYGFTLKWHCSITDVLYDKVLFVKKLNRNQFPTQNVEHVSILINCVCEPELWTNLVRNTFSNWYTYYPSQYLKFPVWSCRKTNKPIKFNYLFIWKHILIYWEYIDNNIKREGLKKIWKFPHWGGLEGVFTML